jgi:hypothetical protein
MAACAIEVLGRGQWPFLHEIQRKLTSELDESVVACFRDNEDSLDLGSYPCAAWSSAMDGAGQASLPSCLDISRTPWAVSANCLVKLPVSSSSSMKSPSSSALPPNMLDLSDSYPLIEGSGLFVGEVTLDEPAELISGRFPACVTACLAWWRGIRGCRLEVAICDDAGP